jgi:GDP-L-fucose synthase
MGSKKMTMSLTINRSATVLITGGTGLVGKALQRVLADDGFTDVVAIGSRDCDLRDSGAVAEFMKRARPDYVFHLAARVYGLGGNALYKSDVLVDNVLINTNVVEQARRAGVKKIVAMGSGCVYPELKGHEELFEQQVWLGPPHPSEDSYGHSKRLMMAQLDAARQQYGLSSAFAISGNLYGPDDGFNIEEGHVVPSLVAKFFAAARENRPVQVWGSGVAIRDFSFSEDAARGLVAILTELEGPVNLGSGMRHPIRDIVETLRELTGVPVEWQSNKPDGQLVRYYNLDKLRSLGFTAKTTLRDGVQRTYRWYEQNWQTARK